MIRQLINSYTILIADIHRLVEGLDAEQFYLQGSEIKNHPAWIIGHLVYSAQAIGAEMGIAHWLSPAWVQLFETGSIPQPEKALYPSPETLMQALDAAAARIIEHLNGLTESALSVPLPDHRYRDVFPTVGHAVVHILVGHTSHHIGQLSLWRKALNLPKI